MKVYIADTNFYLRFILQDNPRQFKIANELLRKAQEGKFKIVFLSEVILEMEFVLKSVYLFSRREIAKALLSLVKVDYLDIEERDLWLEAFEIFRKSTLSLFDIFLFLKAKKEGAGVLSFDEDFKKLARIIK
ncbi:MAG: PIN domain-containing protein [Microgenomates group bacterium]